jgi:hypothetical protein
LVTPFFIKEKLALPPTSQFPLVIWLLALAIKNKIEKEIKMIFFIWFDFRKEKIRMQEWRTVVTDDLLHSKKGLRNCWQATSGRWCSDFAT